MFSAVTTSLVLLCVKYMKPVDVMLWKGWQSRELVWECKATQDFPTIIAPTILLSYCHCPIILLSNYHCPPPFYYPTITAPTILLSLLLFIRTPLSCPQNGFACRPRLWPNKIQRIMALVTDISPMFPSSLPFSQVNISLGGVTSGKSAE